MSKPVTSSVRMNTNNNSIIFPPNSNCIHDRALCRYMSSFLIAHHVKAVACNKVYFLDLDIVDKLCGSAGNSNWNRSRPWSFMVYGCWRARSPWTLIRASNRSILFCTDVLNYGTICLNWSKIKIKYNDKERKWKYGAKKQQFDIKHSPKCQSKHKACLENAR